MYRSRRVKLKELVLGDDPLPHERVPLHNRAQFVFIVATRDDRATHKLRTRPRRNEEALVVAPTKERARGRSPSSAASVGGRVYVLETTNIFLSPVPPAGGEFQFPTHGARVHRAREP